MKRFFVGLLFFSTCFAGDPMVFSVTRQGTSAEDVSTESNVNLFWEGEITEFTVHLSYPFVIGNLVMDEGGDVWYGSSLVAEDDEFIGNYVKMNRDLKNIFVRHCYYPRTEFIREKCQSTFYRP